MSPYFINPPPRDIPDKIVLRDFDGSRMWRSRFAFPRLPICFIGNVAVMMAMQSRLVELRRIPIMEPWFWDVREVRGMRVSWVEGL